MNKKLEKFYRTNFGAFTNLAAWQVENLMKYDGCFKDLLNILFVNTRHKLKDRTSLVTKPVLHSRIQCALSLSKN